jgi:hypothetical protein
MDGDSARMREEIQKNALLIRARNLRAFAGNKRSTTGGNAMFF